MKRTSWGVLPKKNFMIGSTFSGSMEGINKMKMIRTDKIWHIRSTSEIGVHYEVRFCTDGSFVCTCPDFQYRGRQCKHIRKVKMQLAGEAQKNKLIEEEV